MIVQDGKISTLGNEEAEEEEEERVEDLIWGDGIGYGG